MKNRQLIFVYNADSGKLNAAFDIAHKIFSPGTYQCQLCALTHDYFTIKGKWQAFIAQHDDDFVFLHRDEFLAQYPDKSEQTLPAIFELESADSSDVQVRVIVEPQKLKAIKDADELVALVETLY